MVIKRDSPDIADVFPWEPQEIETRWYRGAYPWEGDEDGTSDRD